jgi:uncharacterized membrane protein
VTGKVERYRKLYFDGASTERVILFSDAVFVIAMTLLVLEIKIPELPADQVNTPAFGEALLEQIPHLFGYALSFLFIAIIWMGHHNIWKFIITITGGLMWLNVLLLLVVAFMPVPTALIALYGPESRIPPIAYALCAASLGGLNLGIWTYAHRHGLLSAEVEPDMYVMVRRHLWLSPAVFLVSVVIAVFSPTAAMYSWSSLWLVFFGSRWQMNRWLRSRDGVEEAVQPAVG